MNRKEKLQLFILQVGLAILATLFVSVLYIYLIKFGALERPQGVFPLSGFEALSVLGTGTVIFLLIFELSIRIWRRKYGTIQESIRGKS